MAEGSSHDSTGNFMQITGKTVVAVIVPLYGYWNDVKDNPVDGEVLQAVLERVSPRDESFTPSTHHIILIFVAHPQSIDHKQGDKNSVGNILMTRSAAGNVLNVGVSREATYPDYIAEGIGAALEETNASFIVVLNPWVMIQDGALDVIVNRANFGDNAKIISGFDVRKLITPEGFDTYKTNFPREQFDLSLDFLGMPRYVAEMLSLDQTYKTHGFMARDMWQRMMSKGFDVITTQRIPIFPFEFPWESYEERGDFEADRAYFTQKWHFDAGLRYHEE